MLRLKTVLLAVVIIYLLYMMQVTLVIDCVEIARNFWNISIEYITHFKDKEPYVFMCLPLIAICILGRK